MMNWEGFVRKLSWPNQDTFPEIVWWDWGKLQKSVSE